MPIHSFRLPAHKDETFCQRMFRLNTAGSTYNSLVDGRAVVSEAMRWKKFLVVLNFWDVFQFSISFSKQANSFFIRDAMQWDSLTLHTATALCVCAPTNMAKLMSPQRHLLMTSSSAQQVLRDLKTADLIFRRMRNPEDVFQGFGSGRF